jgi:Spy/CpxP family protein refolding chaperone
MILGLAGVLAAGASYALAKSHGQGFGVHGLCKPGMAKDMAEYRIHRALKQVNASEEQEQKILAILSTQFDRQMSLSGLHYEIHTKAKAALAGDTVDRQALEAIRAQAIQRADERSKEIVQAVADAAEVLTPAQRQKLAELAAKRFE